MPQTILLVEDNPITRKMIRFALEGEDYEVLEAGDGRTALELASRRRPDLVLLDYVLPDTDGLEVLREFRRQPGAAQIPALVLSGMVSQLELLRARSGGFTEFLAKPVEPSRLVQIVRAQLDPGAAKQGLGRRILVVDDEHLNRKLAARRLGDAGFEVETAASGREALGQARRAPPDAILSDVLMPEMDGFELCRSVRLDPTLARVPVVLLSSAYVDDADQKLAHDMGADGLLLRTPDFAEAIRVLATSLRERAPSASQDAGHLTAQHGERVQVQLAKQVARNEALLLQGAIQSAAFSVIRGITEALSRPGDLPAMLGDVLVHCLDAAGLSTGILYLIGPDGHLRLQAQAGLGAGSREAAERCFGHPELLQLAIDSGEPRAFLAGEAHADSTGVVELLAGLGHACALVVPFTLQKEPFGAMLLASDSHDLSEQAWVGFGRALATQFGQAIALGRSLSRLTATEARYQTLVEYANDAILLLDKSYHILEANRAAETLVGVGRTELVGRDADEFIVPEEREESRRRRRDLGADGSIEVQKRHLVRTDGRRVSVEISAALVPVGEEPVILAILRDVSERERAERALANSGRRYRLMFDANPVPMWVVDRETLRFLDVNDAAVRHYGFSRDEFLGMTIEQIRPPEDVGDLLLSWPKPQDPLVVVARRHVKKDGTIIDVEVSAQDADFDGRPARITLARDVTEGKRLAEQLRQSQKMEAIGQLAGGVAHDFNNLLGVITGYSDLLSHDLGAQHPGLSRLEQIRKASDRAAALTRQLLAFSRKQVLQPRVLDLNAVVTDIEKMLRRLIGEDIEMLTVLGEPLERVRADPGQIEQVIVNLVVNARDAMPEGGSLILETDNVELDESYARAHAGARPGDYVLLAVTDTGCGMDAATAAHVFEPFFTTKELGKGTGLGLATVYGIVQQSGGHINLYSEPGHGTSFKIYLPRVSEDDAAATVPAPLREASRGGAETILLVEDEAALRELIQEMLEEAGYTVIVRDRPDETLDAARAHEGPIHLLLTDVVLPGMSGGDVAVRLRSFRPDIRVLFMSGYTAAAISRHGVLESGAELLEKPFTANALLQRVREVLEA